MRRLPLLLIVAALVIVVVAVFGVPLASFEMRRAGLDAESRGYVDRAMQEMATNWRPNELLDRATPDLRANLRREDMDALTDGFAQLGRSWGYDGATGHVNVPYLPIFRGPLTANYVAHVAYAGGVATFYIDLVRDHGTWAIDHFHVDVQLLGHVQSDF